MGLNVLHVASFHGNVGDNASHNGLYRMINSNIGPVSTVKELEIRKAYLNYTGADRWSWDREFVEFANDADLVIVGGGNYFAPWVESSRTGTTVDINIDTLQRIVPPIIFHSIGFDPYKGIAAGALEKFAAFVKAVVTQPKNLIALRNDGSIEHYSRLIDSDLQPQVMRTPDSGFFIDVSGQRAINPFRGQTYVAVNLAIDMLEMRFQGVQECHGYEAYLSEIVSWLVALTGRYTDLKIIFVPHITSDLDAIGQCMQRLPDWLVRSRVGVAPLMQGPGAEYVTFSIYRDARLVAGNRFHTSVCSIALGVPTIGICTYPKLLDLYTDMGMRHRIVMGNEGPFTGDLIRLSQDILDSPSESIDENTKVMTRLTIDAEAVFNEIARRL